MHFIDTFNAQLEHFRRSEKEITEKLSRLPKGKLVKKETKKKIYFYERSEGKEKSLYNDRETLQAYILKSELEAELSAVQKNIRALSNLLSNYCPIALPDEEWNNLHSEENGWHEENKTHSYRGIRYRSKSEVTIAALLTSYKIEFKYEPALKLGNKTIYPDFVIKHPRSGKIIIWEHAGMIGDEQYRSRFFSKLQSYSQYGYALWDNLIYTFDTLDGSLDADYIDKIIRIYFL